MRYAVTMCAAVLLAATAVGQESRRPLSDHDLDLVTAGQDQVVASGHASDDASAVVVNDSSATLVENATVENSATGPASGKGMNVVSAARSMVATGLNVSDGHSLATDSASPVQTSQLNDVAQNSAAAGSVQSIAGGAYIKNINQVIAQMTSSSSSQSRDISSSASSSLHSQTIIQEVNVPGFNPFNSVIDLPKLGIPGSPFTIPGFSFGFDATTGSEPTEFGAAAQVSLGPATVDLGGIVLGKLDLTQDDVILRNPTLDAPSFSLPISGSGKICVFECAGASGSTTFSLNGNDLLSAIGFHGFGDLDLGPNPFKGITIQAGGGVAGVGTGTIDASAGSLRADVNFELKWPDSLQSIDFNIPGFSIPLGDLGSIDVPGHDFGTLSLNVPPVDFSFPLIPELSFGGFHLSSNNAAYCISFQGGCPVVSAIFVDSSTDSSHEEHSASSNSSSSGDQMTIADHEVLFPPTVGGAAGQFVVLGESNLSNQSDSSLKMSGTAQQGFHAFNLLNVTSSLMATGVNVSMTPTLGTGITLSQANNVLQSH